MTDQPAPISKEELIELRKKLAYWRSKGVLAKASRFALLDAVTKSVEYQDLLHDEENAASVATSLDTEIRQKAIALYNADPDKDKHPIPGVDIRETTTISYDAKTAKAFAVKHLMFLELDKKAFEKHAKDHHSDDEELDFVEVKIEPSATIATDLNKFN